MSEFQRDADKPAPAVRAVFAKTDGRTRTADLPAQKRHLRLPPAQDKPNRTTPLPSLFYNEVLKRQTRNQEAELKDEQTPHPCSRDIH